MCGNTYKSNIECIHVSAAEESSKNIVCGVGNRDHTNELFSELRTLKLIDIVKLRSACIMYKAHKVSTIPQSCGKSCISAYFPHSRIFLETSRIFGFILRNKKILKIGIILGARKNVCVLILVSH